MNIHNYYTTLIKRLTKASFVGWVSEGNKKYLQIKIDGKTLSIAFEGYGDATENDYQGLIQQILQNGRKEIQEPVQLHAQEQGVEAVNA